MAPLFFQTDSNKLWHDVKNEDWSDIDLCQIW